MFPIEYCEPNNRNGSEHNIVTIIKNIVEYRLTTEETYPTIHKDWNNINNVFVEHI